MKAQQSAVPIAVPEPHCRCGCKDATAAWVKPGAPVSQQPRWGSNSRSAEPTEQRNFSTRVCGLLSLSLTDLTLINSKSHPEQRPFPSAERCCKSEFGFSFLQQCFLDTRSWHGSRELSRLTTSLRPLSDPSPHFALYDYLNPWLVGFFSLTALSESFT